MKIWYCEIDEAPAPLGEAFEIKFVYSDQDGDTGYEVICRAHAEKAGYILDGEWHTMDDGTQYRSEEL